MLWQAVSATAKAQDAEVDIAAKIMEGYAHDAFFANEKNTADLTLKDGLYFKNGPVVVPDVDHS